MSADALRSASEAIRGLLASRIQNAVVYVGALDDPDAKQADLVLFLYRIGVDADLRNFGHHLPPPKDETAPTIPAEGALPLQLHFLLTAGNQDTGGELQALGNLGLAIQALNDTPILTGTSLGPDPVRVSFDPVSSEELSRIWSLFPAANFRTSVSYLVSPVWIDPAQLRQPAPPVVYERYRSQPA